MSHTTRMRMPFERDGERYHFVSSSTFAEMEASNQFVETTTGATGFRYATSNDSLNTALNVAAATHHSSNGNNNAPKIIVSDLDIKGCEFIFYKRRDIR